MGTLAMPVAGALGAGHIVARQVGLPRLAGLLKPLPIAVFAAMVWQGPSLDGRYSTLVVAGLVCSMVGDICLLEAGRLVARLAGVLGADLLFLAGLARGAAAGAAGCGRLA